MINFHKWVFVGLLFIIFDIWIFVDIFPDFLGVFFISYAFSKAEGKHAKWGFWSSLVVGGVLIPNVFAELANMPANQQITFFVLTNHLISYLYVILYAAFFYVSSARIGEGKIGKLAKTFLTFQILLIVGGIVSPHMPYSMLQDLGVFIILILAIFAVMYIVLIVRIWKRKRLEDAFMQSHSEKLSEENSRLT